MQKIVFHNRLVFHFKQKNAVLLLLVLLEVLQCFLSVSSNHDCVQQYMGPVLLFLFGMASPYANLQEE